MKFTLSFKTPDVLDQINPYWDSTTASEEEKEEMQFALDFARQYLVYSEYIYIEFDTDEKTVTVLKKGKK